MAAFTKLQACLLLTLLTLCKSWDTDDLEIFDLVEEVNKNFYELFDIDQSASSSEIRKAYRRLSLVEHPDKSEAENAEERFRQIVAVYEVLKNPAKREKYNQVLVDGLPDWRQPVFYYRRARKMGMAELFAVLFLIITVGHYFVAWGFYIERRLVVEEVLNSKKKKKKKKQTTADVGPTDEEELQAIPTPRILDLWPFQLSRFLFYSIYNLPNTIKSWQEERKRRKEEEEEAAKLQLLLEQEVEEVRRKPKKKVPQELPEYTNEMYAKFSAPTESNRAGEATEQQTKDEGRARQGQWTDEELVLLSKAVNKFPGGTHQRWEKIAEMVGRSVAEVTAKTKQTKGSYQMSLSTSVQSTNFMSQAGSVSISDNIISQQVKDVDMDAATEGDLAVTSTSGQTVRKRQRPTKIPQSSERTLLISRAAENGEERSAPSASKSVGDDNARNAVKSDAAEINRPGAPAESGSRKPKEPWTQNQQTIFEWALKQYPKGTEARWDKVAEHIPGKSKEDCMARFKELALLVSQRKKMEQQSQQK